MATSNAVMPPFAACMHRRGRYLGLFVLPLLLAGCTTLSEGQCMAGDWYAIGQRDGMHGLERARLFKHGEACAQYGTQPDVRAYDAGRREGLTHYCTPRQGFVEGKEGRSYRGVCPAVVERGFMAAFDDGRAIHDAREALEDVEREMHAKQDRLDDKDTTDKERELLRRDLRRLRDARRHRADALSRLEHRHRRPAWRYP